MKKYIVLVILTALFTTACEKGLDPEIYGSLNPMSFPSNESEYELYMLDLYVPFSCKWPYNEGGTKYHFFGLEEGNIQLFDAPTDLMTIFTSWGNGGVFWDAKSRGNFAPMVGASRNRSHFEKIRTVTKATRIIEDLENATVFTDEDFRTQLIAEARMARGWTMYLMLEMFGPVPVILDPEKVDDPEALADLTRPPRNGYIANTAADLRFAADNLPKDADDYGRFNKGIALTVLMRLYMNEKEFQKAESVGREIQDLGYDLVNDYASLFKEATERNNETIYAISCDPISQGRGSDGNFNAYSYYTRPSDFPEHAGWASPDGVFTATWDFYDSFDPSDARRTLLIDSYGTRTRTEMIGAVINKYPPEGSNAFQGNDIVLARYADVLLLLAEAINENNSGPTQEAIDLVNEIRNRAGIGALSSADAASKDAFNDAILRERGWELYFEGFRLFDLRRHGKWPSALENIDGKQPGPSIFPIPQYAVDDGATQNAEYAQ